MRPLCAPHAGASWQVVEDLAAAPGVTLQLVGPRQQPFPRPPPRSVEASLLSDFYESFNLMQDVSPQGDNWFTATAEQVGALGRSRLPSGCHFEPCSILALHCALSGRMRPGRAPKRTHAPMVVPQN